jgi:hypothetical protein
MIGSINQRYFNVYNLISRKNTVFQRFTDSGLNRSYVFPRDSSPDDFVYKFDASTCRARFKDNLRMTILPATTGLTNELAFGLARLRIVSR